jgi:hypothetical protein
MGSLIEKYLKYVRGYEDLRYRLRDKPNMLAVEGVCNSCNRPSSFGMDLIEYFEIKDSPYTPGGRTCPWCGSSSTLSISLPYC